MLPKFGICCRELKGPKVTNFRACCSVGTGMNDCGIKDNFWDLEHENYQFFHSLFSQHFSTILCLKLYCFVAPMFRRTELNGAMYLMLWYLVLSLCCCGTMILWFGMPAPCQFDVNVFPVVQEIGNIHTIGRVQ